jgi:hypothetical protein
MIIPNGTTVDITDAEDMAALTNPVAPFNSSTRPIIQNLGPGILYVGTSPESLATYGLKMPVNAVYEMPAILVEGPNRLCLLASGDECDVRILNVG